MSKGVFTFRGGTDVLVSKMVKELKSNGVELRKCSLVEKILVEEGSGHPQVAGVVAKSLNTGDPVPPRRIRCKAILSNANVLNTIHNLVGEEHFSPEFRRAASEVRVNSSSCQVYMGIRAGESIPNIGDLVFTSDAGNFSTNELTDRHTKSRTFSFYYPEIRPHLPAPRYSVVASLNARWEQWDDLSDEEYEAEKERICEEAVSSLERFIPGVREKIDHIEAATPRTVKHFTRHMGGTSFGTKFEGLQVSMDLPSQLSGLYHAGSVGIIMSGWLGAINYGVIVANKLDKFLYAEATQPLQSA